MSLFQPLSNLRVARKAIKLRQIDLAEATGLLQGRISDLERGAASPSTEELLLFANFFHTSIDYILGRTADPRPPSMIHNDPDNLSIKITQLFNSLKPEQQVAFYNAAVDIFKEIKLKEAFDKDH